MAVLDRLSCPRLMIQGVGLSYEHGCLAASSSSRLPGKNKTEPSALGLSFICLFQSYASDFFPISAQTMLFAALF